MFPLLSQGPVLTCAEVSALGGWSENTDQRRAEYELRASQCGEAVHPMFLAGTYLVADILQDAAGRDAGEVLADVLTAVNAIRAVEHELWLEEYSGDEEIGDGASPPDLQPVWTVQP